MKTYAFIYCMAGFILGCLVLFVLKRNCRLLLNWKKHKILSGTENDGVNVKDLERVAENARVKALEEARAELESIVDKRTAQFKANFAELSRKTNTLARFQKITVGRELEMIALKAKINSLLKELGRKPLYTLPENSNMKDLEQ